MRPENLKTKIFLDGGDPQEAEEIIQVLGFLDGQTTNPTLISRNPAVTGRLERGDYFSEDEILENYRSIVNQFASLIPDGSISIEVNADNDTTAEEMLAQARQMFSWIPNAHIKLPTIREGLRAAEQAVKENIRVNMTLTFTQEQAAAVHSATHGALKGSVFVSPFIGRLDDMGYNGMELIDNIMKMYRQENSHVELLVASVRTMGHFLMSLHLQADIVTCPYKILKQWADDGARMPDGHFQYDAGKFKSIPYKEIDLKKPWHEIGFTHELIDKGVAAFAKDWAKLTGRK
ncbi:MAG: transaldolase family protein [Desulfatiglandaceae bacterium]